MPPIPLIPSQTVKAQLALRELILGGELAPGARIPELALVERLGVSRTPVRAALVRLADGFDRTHRCGVRVRRVIVRPSGITLEMTARYDPAIDIEGAKEKADLLRMVFGRAVTIRTVSAGT